MNERSFYADKTEWLEIWNYEPGTPEAEEAWRLKCELDEKIYSQGSEIRGNDGIIPDIAPYKSMIDGSIIESRSKHRSHLKDHGCIEVGNEKMKPKESAPPSGLRDRIGRAVYQHWRK